MTTKKKRQLEVKVEPIKQPDFYSDEDLRLLQEKAKFAYDKIIEYCIVCKAAREAIAELNEFTPPITYNS